jgi:hypothetical protein
VQAVVDAAVGWINRQGHLVRNGTTRDDPTTRQGISL